MSALDNLKMELLQQECHFTWSLTEVSLDLHDLVNRLEEQIRIESGKARVIRAYNSLAFVSFLYNDLQAALTNLYKSEELAKAHYGNDSDTFLIVTYGDLAWLYYHIEKIDLSEDYLRQLITIRLKFSEMPNNVVQNEVLKEKAWALLKFSNKYYNGARECFRQALEMNPKDSDLNSGYAIALYRTTTDRSGSMNSQTVAQLRRAIDLNPDDAVLLMLLALRLLYINNIPISPKSAIQDPLQLINSREEVRLVIRALEMSPESPHVMRYVAKFCRKMGSCDFAICQLEKTLDHTPNSAFIHHQLALCYKNKKLFFEEKYGPCTKVDAHETQYCLEKCIYHLQQAVSLKPSFIFALAELAGLYGQMKNIPEAEKLFQQAFQSAHERKEHLQIVHALYGQFQQYSKGSEQLAIYHYMEGLRLQTDPGESKQCETKLEKIVQFRFSKNPDDSKAYAIQGFIHEIRGKIIKATECYQKILSPCFTFEQEQEESLLYTELRVWLLGCRGAEKSAKHLIIGSHTHDARPVGPGIPEILKGTMVKKTVVMVEADLCNAKKTLTREKSVLTPGPHAIVLAFFYRHGEFTEDTKKMLEDLAIFGENIWKHVIVVFTEVDTSISNFIRSQGSVLQWLLEKCENRCYITGTGTQVTQTIELSERIMRMILRNNTMHLVVPEISNKEASLKLVEELETGILFTPEIITEKGQLKYRFLCPHNGWFQCTYTNLGFRMMGKGELLYMTIDECSDCPVSTNRYAAGPLYEITCVQGELSELQLPHCEESSDDCTFMTVAHYTGGNMEILEPQRVSHTHVNVSIPGTSKFRLENLLNFFKRRIRGHVILIYQQHNHRLMVYLQPSNVDPQVVSKRVEGGELLQIPGRCNLEHDSKYTFLCNPQPDSVQSLTAANVQPDTVHFQRDCKYYYQDFDVDIPHEIMHVNARLQQCCNGKTVWKYAKLPLTGYQKKSILMNKRGHEFWVDLGMPQTHGVSGIGAKLERDKAIALASNRYILSILAFNWPAVQFVERHKADLIRRVSLVEPIADDLHWLIKDEKYSQIIAASTSQDKMRKLFSFLSTPTLKEKFYESLLKNELQLVEDLGKK